MFEGIAERLQKIKVISQDNGNDVIIIKLKVYFHVTLVTKIININKQNTHRRQTRSMSNNNHSNNSNMNINHNKNNKNCSKNANGFKFFMKWQCEGRKKSDSISIENARKRFNDDDSELWLLIAPQYGLITCLQVVCH